MGANTEISWTDHTFNPWTGCAKVSPGCLNCYAEGWAKRSGIVKWGGPRRRTSVQNWNEPRRWNKWSAEAVAMGTQSQRPRVFCASLADWLDDEVPVEWLAELLALIHETPHLDWLLLTKRPQNWLPRMLAVAAAEPGPSLSGLGEFIGRWIQGERPANVWIGTTVEDQKRANERIPALLKIPSRVRFLSCEPLLGPVNLTVSMPGGSPSYNSLKPYRPDYCKEPLEPSIHWVICGGESGPGARPMHPDWARSLRDDCAVARVAFHFKQWGEWLPDNQRDFRTSGNTTWGLIHKSGNFRSCIVDGKRVSLSDTTWRNGESGTTNVGKKVAGRLLDGVEHNAFPEVAS